jgi:hypothetical protein
MLVPRKPLEVRSHASSLPASPIKFSSSSFGNLVQKGDGYELTVPRYSKDSSQPMLWVERDLGPCVVAAFKNYKHVGADIIGKEFYASSTTSTFPDLAEALSKALGKPVSFVSPPTCGMEDLDLMVCHCLPLLQMRADWLPSPH